MATEVKQGFWGRLFGAKKSHCCDVQIVELTDEAAADPEDKGAVDTAGNAVNAQKKSKDGGPGAGGSCCGR